MKARTRIRAGFCVIILNMSWGTRRRNKIVFFTFFFFAVIGVIIGVTVFYKEPTCFDGLQNGSETGVDCGGTCELLCSDNTFAPLVHWTRFFYVSKGFYNAIAYVENRNPSARADNLSYVFRMYDKDNVLLHEQFGQIDLKPRQIIPIIETGFQTGEKIPTYITFDFTEDIYWQKSKKRESVITIKDEAMRFDDGFEKITAEAYNNSLEDIKDISFIVIVYDLMGNAIASSSTYFDKISGNQTVNLNFSWPSRFGDQVSRFEIIPLYD